LHQAAQQEAIVNNGEAARLERELAHARTAALANGMGVKSRLQAVQVQCVMLDVSTTYMLTMSQISGTDRQGRETKRGDGPRYHKK
jgi:hypothetical protein